MGLSDWLTIVFSLVGIGAGAGVSWVFFRTQLTTDFRSLCEKLSAINVPRDVNAVIYPHTAEIKDLIRNCTNKIEIYSSAHPNERNITIEKLHKLQADLCSVKDTLNIINHVDNSKEISALKFAVERLETNLNTSVKEILNNVKNQQIELANRIQTTYKDQAITATATVRNAFSAEIKKFVTDTTDREKLLKNLIDSFMEGMRTMGEYQRKNIEMETTSSIREIEKKICTSINEVVGEVTSLKMQLTHDSSRDKK